MTDVQLRRARIGLGIAVLGLLVAAASLLPTVTPVGRFPWLILVGSVIYLPGGFLIAAHARGDQGKSWLLALRVIRLAFAAVMLVVVLRMFAN